MTLWLNIYAKEVAKLAAFYTALGFQPNPKIKATEREASFTFDNKVTLMIFQEGFFQKAFPWKLAVPKKEASILFSFDMPSIEDAEALVRKAVSLGGKDLSVIKALKNKGFYNTGFVDPEGHLWNILVN